MYGFTHWVGIKKFNNLEDLVIFARKTFVKTSKHYQTNWVTIVGFSLSRDKLGLSLRFVVSTEKDRIWLYLLSKATYIETLVRLEDYIITYPYLVSFSDYLDSIEKNTAIERAKSWKTTSIRKY